MRNSEKEFIKGVQNEMNGMLKKLVKFFEENNLTYWIDSGTLLGSVRHSGFIPWDDDIDICMPREDYKRFIKMDLSKFYEELYIEVGQYDYNIVLWTKVKSKNVLIIEKDKPDIEQGLFIDIFPVDIVSNKFYERMIKKISRVLILTNWKQRNNMDKNKLIKIYNKVSKKILKVIHSLYLKRLYNGSYISYGVETPFLNVWKYEHIFPLKKGRFDNIDVYCPNNTHEYLGNIYGVNYMQLPPEEDRESPHIKSIIKMKF